MRTEALPLPRIGAHVREAMCRAPAKKGGCLAGIGITGCDITGAARRDFVRDTIAAGLLKGPDNFQHAVPSSGSEIDREAFRPVHRLFQRFQSLEVADGKVYDVNVVAHAGPVMRGVVIAEHIEVRPAADGHLCDERHQVIGGPLRIFTDQTADMCADRIEVSENPDTP